MKFKRSQFREAELSDQEMMALRGIAGGGFIALPLCKRLQKLGLLEKENDRWAITQQGHIRLMFWGAR